MNKKAKHFDKVDQKVNFPEEEKKLLDFWYKKGVVKKYLNKNSESKKTFSFLDGPITANNPMGVHHAWGRTYKDLWQRFKNMQGFRERFQNGFDAQGLWVEVEVEKELGFKNKKDIEKFGVSEFVELCKKRVKKYSEIQTEQSKRLGYFMDWDNSYYTLSDDNNYMIWHFLKTVHENGWLYKGKDSVAWCPRCETAISQHEMLTEDYKEISHESVYMAFPIVGHENEYFMVWTTTPWTIPANIAIAVDEKILYSKVEVGGKVYWMAKEAVQRVMGKSKYKILKDTLGGKLVGWKYKGTFDDLPIVADVMKKYSDNFHSVVATDNLILPVTTTEGTGLVHTAVSAGTEDFRLGKKLGLPMIPVIEDDASYSEGLGFLTGLNAKKNPRIILDHLEKLDKEGKHFYFKIENYLHRYPACWRCKTELVWKVTDEWYISMDKSAKMQNDQFQITNEENEIKTNTKTNQHELQTQHDDRTLRQRMIDVAKKIIWIPAFGLERELDWLTNMHDWLIIKKNRYWGLALPIWECKKCGHFEVIGSKEELREKAVKGFDKFNGKSPHKPQIDQVKIKCAKCGEISDRIEPVGNPWLDAGIVTYSTVSDGNKASNFEPNNKKPLYIANKESWKKWVPADFITESFPGQFKNWFYSLIAMSTVLEDLKPFNTVLGFGTLFADDGRPMHKSWGNMIEFGEGADKIGVDVMRWMYARQNPSDNLLFGYKTADETRRRFHLKLWNVYNFFITYANIDDYVPGKNLNIKKNISNLSILDQWIIKRLEQTINLVTECLEKFEAQTSSAELDRFVDDLSLWYIRRSRDRVGPAAEDKKDKKNFYDTTYYLLTTLSTILAPFIPFMSDMIFRNLTKKESVHLADWPKDTYKLSNEDEILLSEMAKIREIVERAHSQRKDIGIPVKQPLSSFSVNYLLKIEGLEYLIKDEVNVKEVKWERPSGGNIKIKFDTKITKELENEAKARELIRNIQEERKNMRLDLSEKVDVKSEWIPDNSEMVGWVLKKAQVSDLSQGKFKVNKSS